MGIRVPFDRDYDSRWLRVGWKKMKKQRGDAWDRREIMKRRERKEVKGNDERGKRELAKLDNGEGFLEQTPDVSGEWMKRDTYRKAKREQWPRYYFLFAASDQPLTISPVRRCSSTPSFYLSFFPSTLLPFSPFFPFNLSLPFSVCLSSRVRSFFPDCCNATTIADQNPRLRARYLPNKRIISAWLRCFVRSTE